MKKIILIVVSLAIMIGFFVFGLNYSKNVYSNFQSDGYIIESDSNNRQFFNSNGQYKVTESSQIVEYINSDNETKTVPSDTFIHYVDGSLSVFKKAAVVDLSNMNKKSFQYYTVFNGSVFTKVGNDYRISYLDKQLSFNKFLIKISPNKYLVASPSLTYTIGDETKDVKAGFLELTYADGNIVKLLNQEVDIKNISSKITINLDDSTYINLSNKKIYSKTQEKINLGEITINSDDNIEIIQDENNTIINPNGSSDTDKDKDKDKSDTETTEEETKKKKVIHQGDFEEVANGLIDAAEIEVETIVEENAAIKDAVFTIDEFSVTANTVNASVKITDEESVLTDSLTIKIIKAATNEVIYYANDSSGSNFVSLEVMTLSPQTSYILIMNQDYKKNGITYNRDFIQKTFITPSLGISLSKDFVTSDELSVDVLKNNYSKVTELNYLLHDVTTNLDVKEGTATFGETVNSNNLDFKNLNSNHEYRLYLYNFTYGNTIVNTTSSEYTYNLKTLKIAPVVTNTSFSIDKKNSKFVVYLNNIKDVDAGLVGYRADVHLKSSNEFITSKTSSTGDSIEFQVDEELLERNKHYNVYIYLIFNDNEKEYELPIGLQEVVLEGVQGPVVTWEPKTVTFEKINGFIYIQDDNETINPNEKIYVTYRNISIDDGTDNATLVEKYDPEFVNGKATILFDKNNLKRSSSYLFTVKAYVDYKEGGEEQGYTLTDIASFIVNTIDPSPLAFSPTNLTQSHPLSSFFLLGRLKNYVPEGETLDEENMDTLPADTMAMFGLMFYSVNYDKSMPCIPDNKCWIFTDEDNDDDDYVSTLRAKYYDRDFEIDENLFGITDQDDIPYGQYMLEIIDPYDYTTYKNKLDVISQPIEISVNSGGTRVISKNNPIDVRLIYNEGTYDYLDENIQIGFKLTGNLVKNVNVNYVTYSVYDANSTSTNPIYSETIPSTDGKVPSLVVDLSSDQRQPIRRGGSYKFRFTVDYEGCVQPEMSEPTKTYVTEKQEPTIEVYQSDRTDENVIFKYRLLDPDWSLKEYDLTATYLYYYINSRPDNDENLGKVQLTRTTGNNWNAFEIPITSGNLYGFIQYKLKDLDVERNIDLISYRFADIVTEDLYGTPSFTMNTVDNAIVLSFPSLSRIQSDQMIGMDVRFTNTAGLYVDVLNKTLSSDKTITVPFATLKKLKSLNEANKLDISAEVQTFYDTNIYGIDSPGKGYGLAIQSSNTYLRSGSTFSYTVQDFDKINKRVTFKYRNSNATKEYDYAIDGGYFVFSDTNHEYKSSLKTINKVEAECDGNCTFWFDTIKPTINISGTRPGLTTFSFHNSITGIDDDDLENFQIIVRVFKTDSTYGNRQEIDATTYTLNNFNNKDIIIDGLEMNSYYVVEYTYTTDGTNEHDFYFSNVSSGIYSSKFKTRDNIGLKNVSAYYQSAGDLFDYRYLVIEHGIEVLDGYGGIKYIVYNSEGTPVITEDISAPIIKSAVSNGAYAAVIDIKERLTTEDNYTISLISYGTDGQELNGNITGVGFNFKIMEPVISITRRTDVDENKFNVRVILRDSYDALGPNKTFNVYAECNGVETLLGQGTSGQAINFDDIICEGKTCDIKVKYLMDDFNTGEYTEKVRSATFAMNPINIGTAVISSTGNNTNIPIAFINSVRINLINRIAYTIYDEDMNIVNTASFVPRWNENSTIINENLENGTYYLMLQLYYDEELVGRVSLDYVKGSGE